MKKPLIILKAAFLFGGPAAFSENLNKSDNMTSYEQNLKNVTVTRMNGEGNESKAETNIVLRVYKPTEYQSTYKETKNQKGEFSMVIPDSKNVDVSFEYRGLDEKDIKKSIRREKQSSKENLYVNLSHLDSHHNKKGRLVVVTKYR